jgi:polar amino acid transport system substrate-binding protein
MISRRLIAATAATTAAALAMPAVARAQDAESAWARIRRTKTLRIGAVPNGAPYYYKDPATGDWKGFYYDLSKTLAADLEAELQIVETVWGSGVLDLQSRKIDIFFGLAPTPKRALSIDFTEPLFTGVLALLSRKDLPESWQALDHPETRLAVDLGSSHDQTLTIACPNATIMRFKTVDEATLALQSGRADAQALAILLAMTAQKKLPGLGKIIVPSPRYQNESAAGIAREPDKTFRDYLGYWIRFYRGNGTIRSRILDSLALIGLDRSDWPKDLPL